MISNDSARKIAVKNKIEVMYATNLRVRHALKEDRDDLPVLLRFGYLGERIDDHGNNVCGEIEGGFWHEEKRGFLSRAVFRFG